MNEVYNYFKISRMADVIHVSRASLFKKLKKMESHVKTKDGQSFSFTSSLSDFERKKIDEFLEMELISFQLMNPFEFFSEKRSINISKIIQELYPTNYKSIYSTISNAVREEREPDIMIECYNRITLKIKILLDILKANP